MADVKDRRIHSAFTKGVQSLRAAFRKHLKQAKLQGRQHAAEFRQTKWLNFLHSFNEIGEDRFR